MHGWLLYVNSADTLAPHVLVFRPVLETVREARHAVAVAFAGWGLEDYVARTVVSELVTNAVVHGSRPGDYVVVRTYLDGDGFPVIEVWDQSAEHPKINMPTMTDECGRGLYLMQQLVRTWGVRPTTECGKVVFAVLEPMAAS